MKRNRPSPLLPLLLLLPIVATALAPVSDADARRAYPRVPIRYQCREIRGLVLDLAAQQALNEYYGFDHYYLRGAVVDAATSGEKSGSESGPGHHTGTNNQETGVDEADMVKTNGRYIFTIRAREVIVTRAWPTRSMKVVARFSLSASATPSQLQLYGNKLVVLANVWVADKEDSSGSKDSIRGVWQRPQPSFSGTRVSVYDISRAASPRLVSEVDVEGWLTRSRNIGDDVYLVTNSGLRVPPTLARIARLRAGALPKLDTQARYDWQKIEAARKAGLPVVRAYLERHFRSLSLDEAMPRTRVRIGSYMTDLVPMYSCNQLTVPANRPPDQTGVLNVTHIDLDSPAVADWTGIVGNGWEIYASQNSLYVTMPDYSWSNGQSANSSQVHKFTLRTPTSDRPHYQASGTVPGHLLNQFSMSEHNGFLRIMTTDQQWGRQGRVDTAANNLFVMRPVGGKLQIVGSLRGLAEGERIYSARMFGDKGYMVTFRQTDPLFTFDLSDPFEPRMVGELKINGFSSYIHPLDGDRLLTIGRDADKDGRVNGLLLQIFDVSNPAKPTRTHRRLLSGGRWAYSAAQYDHHAFTYDARTQTLAIPVSSYDAGESYSGLEVFDISRRGIRYRGAVSHGNLPNASTDQWRGSWERTVQRSMIIGDALVSISGAGIVASNVTHPSWTLSTVSFVRPRPIPRKKDRPLIPYAVSS